MSAMEDFSPSVDDALEIDFVGEVRSLLPGDDLRFGRNADLVIDENPFMHRVVGRFTFREGVWWLQNHGTQCRLELHDLNHGTVLEAAPAQQVPVVGTKFAVRFTAGPTTYELTGTREGTEVQTDTEGDVIGTATMDFGQVPLSPEQHLLVVALYDSKLRTGDIEGNTVIAHRLGWTSSKFNRKLDTICEKFHRAGLRGVKGDNGGMAEGRRGSLMAHCIGTGLVSRGDLALLRGVG